MHEDPNGPRELTRKYLTAALWVFIPVAALALVLWRRRPSSKPLAQSQVAPADPAPNIRPSGSENLDEGSEFGRPSGPEPDDPHSSERSSAEYVVGRVGNFTQRTGQPERSLFFIIPNPPTKSDIIWNFVVMEDYAGRTLGHSIEMRGKNFVGSVVDGQVVKFRRNRVRGGGKIVKLTELIDLRGRVRIYVKS